MKRAISLLAILTLTMSMLGIALAPSPALAAGPKIGPCQTELHRPHISTQVRLAEKRTVLRSHTRHYCAPGTHILYITAYTIIYKCAVFGQPTSRCSVAAEHLNSHQEPGGVHYGTSSVPLTTADTKNVNANPESGYYIAEAVYEVCRLKGIAESTAFDKSEYVFYDGSAVSMLGRVLGELPPT